MNGENIPFAYAYCIFFFVFFSQNSRWWLLRWSWFVVHYRVGTYNYHCSHMYKINDTKHYKWHIESKPPSYLEFFVCKTFLVFVFYVFLEVLSKLMFVFARVLYLGLCLLQVNSISNSKNWIDSRHSRFCFIQKSYLLKLHSHKKKLKINLP
jgi:hypothetical protein